MNPLIPRGPYRVIGDAENRGDMRVSDANRELAVILADTAAPIRNPATRALANAFAALPDLIEALEPDFLETIAAEIDCFEHSARTAGLRALASRQRAALAKANGEG